MEKPKTIEEYEKLRYWFQRHTICKRCNKIMLKGSKRCRACYIK